MTDLKIRRIPFSFEGVEFIWNPANPAFSILMNKISFFAIAFEKYICQAVHDAESRITDPAVLAEARAFRAQEATHSLAHRKHAKALIERYPGLQGTLDRTIAGFEALYAQHPLEFHLGYVGGLESVFTPYFSLLIDQRDRLFAQGDTRVASLMLWHFCEEIEHRSSGLIVYNHVVGRYLYRLRNYRKYTAHSAQLLKDMGEDFLRYVPGIDPADLNRTSSVPLPRRDQLRSFVGILAAQLPWHNPEYEKLPAYFREWYDRFERGENMARTYGVGAERLAA